jgi:hypothetical protein
MNAKLKAKVVLSLQARALPIQPAPRRATRASPRRTGSISRSAFRAVCRCSVARGGRAASFALCSGTAAVHLRREERHGGARSGHYLQACRRERDCPILQLVLIVPRVAQALSTATTSSGPRCVFVRWSRPGAFRARRRTPTLAEAACVRRTAGGGATAVRYSLVAARTAAPKRRPRRGAPRTMKAPEGTAQRRLWWWPLYCGPCSSGCTGSRSRLRSLLEARVDGEHGPVDGAAAQRFLHVLQERALVFSQYLGRG